jgi:hypothetical protein
MTAPSVSKKSRSPSGSGFDGSLTAQLTVAVINIHHFVVDAYIWKLRQAPNYRVVVGSDLTLPSEEPRPHPA